LLENLEAKRLPPMDYLSLAYEFNVSHWKDKALDGLVSCDESLTVSEVEIIGIEAHVALAKRREARLSLRSREPPAKRPRTTAAPTTSDVTGNKGALTTSNQSSKKATMPRTIRLDGIL
jgi:hypothetical protein